MNVRAAIKLGFGFCMHIDTLVFVRSSTVLASCLVIAVRTVLTYFMHHYVTVL